MAGGAAGGAEGVFCTANDQFLSFSFSCGVLWWKGERGWKDGVEPPAENVKSDDVGAKEGICEPSEVVAEGVVDLGRLPAMVTVVL